MATLHKFLFGILAFSLAYTDIFGQADKAKEAYLNFTVYRTDKGTQESITKVKALLKLSDWLTKKQITNATYNLGKMYEDVDNSDSAAFYYEKSLLGEPNYFVVHRALGFIYMRRSKIFIEQMKAAHLVKDVEANNLAFDKFKATIREAIPHLEKYQACEPDDDTLTIIKNCYKTIKDEKAIDTLAERLKLLAEHCVSLLDD